MKKIALLSFLFVFLVSGAAMALPIPPAPLVPPVAGQSELVSINGPNPISVDWVVTDAETARLGSANQFAYLYQIENTSDTVVDHFTVSFDTSSVIMAGTFPHADLDMLHNSGEFPNLATETETASTFQNVIAEEQISSDNISWNFKASLDPGSESSVLFFTSPFGPEYVHALAIDSDPDAPWVSNAPGGDMVPAPAIPSVPEPATLLLLGSGLIGLAGLGRKKLVTK
jgi:hypothetical protein